MRETVARVAGLSSEPDEYWDPTGMAIRSVIYRQAPGGRTGLAASPRLAWAGAMALSLVLRQDLLGPWRGSVPPPVVGTERVLLICLANDPDHELLLAVEHGDAEQRVPEALGNPLAYFWFEEINRKCTTTCNVEYSPPAVPTTGVPNKETCNENLEA